MYWQVTEPRPKGMIYSLIVTYFNWMFKAFPINPDDIFNYIIIIIIIIIITIINFIYIASISLIVLGVLQCQEKCIKTIKT